MCCYMLQCIAVYCSVLQDVERGADACVLNPVWYSAVQCVALRCRVLQHPIPTPQYLMSQRWVCLVDSASFRPLLGSTLFCRALSANTALFVCNAHSEQPSMYHMHEYLMTNIPPQPRFNLEVFFWKSRDFVGKTWFFCGDHRATTTLSFHAFICVQHDRVLGLLFRSLSGFTRLF